MKLPVIQGIIRRRILVNYRVQAEAIRKLLPPVFSPKLHNGFAIAGICLIRLEQVRPTFFPAALGIASENAAHRIAVSWRNDDGSEAEGVYIPRRDTNSWLNRLAGGRVFPGEHEAAQFEVHDADGKIDFSMKSSDGRVEVRFKGAVGSALPKRSCFSNVEEISAFFEAGSTGYSAKRDSRRMDGLALRTKTWRVEPLELECVHSSFFLGNEFPEGSVEFDSALIMRDIPHEWHVVPQLGRDQSCCANHPSTPSTGLTQKAISIF